MKIHPSVVCSARCGMQREMTLSLNSQHFYFNRGIRVFTSHCRATRSVFVLAVQVKCQVSTANRACRNLQKEVPSVLSSVVFAEGMREMESWVDFISEQVYREFGVSSQTTSHTLSTMLDVRVERYE